MMPAQPRIERDGDGEQCGPEHARQAGEACK
jgi:hypothetical protein